MKMNILLILLGCNVWNLLNNRINAAINFASKFNETNIDWFLSGGIKNKNEDFITEAEKMAKLISIHEKWNVNEDRKNKWNYVYDVEATNTAENFVMAREYLKRLNKIYDEVYIITSEFHYDRANKMAQKLLNLVPKWILGNKKLHDSEYWERIHIKNVEIDINKAFQKFNT